MKMKVYPCGLSLRIIASILLIMAAAACGRRTAPAESTGRATQSTAVTETATPPRSTAADLAALSRILQHHEQTVALAQRAVERAVHPALRDFAGGVLRDRRQEIDELRGLGATSRAAAVAAPELDEATNETIDVLFVTTLAAHEEEGRTMARELLAATAHPDVKSFAEGLINKAGSEITQLDLWKQQWSQMGHQDR